MELSSIMDPEKLCVCTHVALTSLWVSEREAGVEFTFRAAASSLQREAGGEGRALIPAECSGGCLLP